MSASEFFMRDDPVFRTLRSITAKLKELDIPYAVAGGMALVAHGYDRTTADVDILVTPDGLSRIHAALDGLGYLPPFAGSKHLRDGTTKVRIEFLTTGGFPGDGKPKPAAFPDPQEVGVEIDGIHYLRLEKLVELKLASGMTARCQSLKRSRRCRGTDQSPEAPSRFRREAKSVHKRKVHRVVERYCEQPR